MTRSPYGGDPARRRRLAAVPALVGIAFLLTVPLGATPAAADSPLTIQLDTPSGQTVSDGGTVRVAGRVDAGLGPTVDGIRIRVVREADGVTVLDKSVCCATPTSGVVPFSATTDPLAVNGSYKATVTATGYLELVLAKSPVEPATATASFKMAVPPAAPANVKVAIQGDRSALVTWSAVPAYSDFVGYAVYRKTGSAPFQAVKGIEERSTTSFVDTSLGNFSGPIQYQVASIRGVKSDQKSWLITLGDPVAGTVPPPPTTAPPAGGDGSTSTTAPGGGLQQGGAASADLGGFFSSQPQPIPVPPASPPPTFPDTGYSELLPFGALPNTTEPPDKVGGRSQGRSASASGSGDVESEELSGVNRRALLVPIAAGSVLCVTALHLRWLNRRLAASGVAAVSGSGATGAGTADLQPLDADLDPVEPGDAAFRPDREPVGASW